jgi:hypothetical protein
MGSESQPLTLAVDTSKAWTWVFQPGYDGKTCKATCSPDTSAYRMNDSANYIKDMAFDAKSYSVSYDGIQEVKGKLI